LPKAKLGIASWTNSRGIYFSTFSDGVLENFLPVDAVVVVLDENASEQFLYSGRYLGIIGNDHVFIFQHFDQLCDRFTFERTFSKHHLVKHHSHGPNICLNCINFSLNDLGRHVDGRAKHGLRKLVGVFEWLAKAKISNFDTSVVHEDVVRLDIAVHDVTSR
jgi:hypothetical protein